MSEAMPTTTSGRPSRLAGILTVVCVLVAVALPASGATAAVGWSELQASVAPSAIGPDWASVFDARAGRYVFLGPGPNYTDFETWSYDLANNSWTHLTPTGTPPIQGGSMVYDSRDGRILLHGGLRFTAPNRFTPTNETWSYEYTTNTWALLGTSVRLPAVIGGALAYDPVADRVLLFGGDQGGFGFMNGTWAYDPTNNSWKDLHPTTAPPQNAYAGMGYDPLADRFLLFGGLTYNVTGCAWSSSCLVWFTNATWAFDPGANAWSRLPSGPAVGGTTYFLDYGLPPRLTYDAHLDRLLLTGRWTRSESSWSWNETWTLDASTGAWTNVTASAGPGLGREGAFFYDARVGCSVLITERGVWGYGCGGGNGVVGLVGWGIAGGAVATSAIAAAVVFLVRRRRRTSPK